MYRIGREFQMAHGKYCNCKGCNERNFPLMHGKRVRSYRRQSWQDQQGVTSESETNHSGGWHEAQHGWIGDRPVTFALGWGSKEGEVLLADGHINTAKPGPFWEHGGHNHYGKGRGPNANVKDRGMYRGPGA